MERIYPDPEPRYVDGDRLDHIRNGLRDSQFDALLGLSPANSYYLTGAYVGFYHRPLAGLVTEDSAVFLGSALRSDTVRRTSWCDYAIVYEDTDDPYSVLAAGVEEFGISSVGVDISETKSGLIAGIQSNLDIDVVDSTDLFRKLRTRKTDWEVEMIRKAGDLADAGMAALIEDAEPGARELELVNRVNEAYVDRYLADHSEFRLGTASEPSQYSFTNVLAGAHGMDPGTLSTGKMAGEGTSVVGIAIPAIQGYVCENERTVLVGDPPNEVRSAMESLVNIRTSVLDFLGPDINAAQVDKYANDLMADKGYQLYHRSGHGLGITFHEPPYLNQTQPLDLQPGMVVTVEPGIYLEDRDVALRHSDTILITSTGTERLTTLWSGPIINP